MIGIGINNGKIFNVNDKTNPWIVTTSSFSYTPIVGDFISIERQLGKYVLSKKNTNLTFAVFITLSDTDYPTAYNVVNNTFGLSIVAYDGNVSPNGIIKNVMVNYNSSNLQELTTPINPFKSKIWNVLGDSFTYQNIYPGLVKSYLGITTINNYGVSSTKIADPNLTDNTAMSVRYASMSTSANLVTILGETNDFSYNVPLGTVNDITRATFYGALRVML